VSTTRAPDYAICPPRRMRGVMDPRQRRAIIAEAGTPVQVRKVFLDPLAAFLTIGRQSFANGCFAAGSSTLYTGLQAHQGCQAAKPEVTGSNPVGRVSPERRKPHGHAGSAGSRRQRALRPEEPESGAVRDGTIARIQAAEPFGRLEMPGLSPRALRRRERRRVHPLPRQSKSP
jgi:hypothetical protein